MLTHNYNAIVTN